MKNLKTIRIGEKNYPIKIDLNVLAELQEMYGSLTTFEFGIRGIKGFAKDKDGNQKYDKDGNPLMIVGEPSIKDMARVLPLMINEGLAIEAEEKGIPFEAVTDLQIIEGCRIDYSLLSKMIIAEYERCFEIKK